MTEPTTQALIELADKYAFFMPGSAEGAKVRQQLLDALEAQAREIERLQVEAEQLRKGHFDASETASVLRAERAPLTLEQCKAKFEAWYASAPDEEPEPDRTYELSDESMSELTKDCIWLGWQAALDAAQQEPVNAMLVEALEDAATSLETIGRLAGKSNYVGDGGERVETFMGHHDQVRGYAQSRASVARAALTQQAPKGGE